jgi:uncharacterized protein YggU (UPF0235/DUF167 family)
MRFVTVTVTPGAKKESCVNTHKDRYAIGVKERAHKNAANKRLLLVLARHLDVAPKKLRIVTGHRGRNKRVEVLE